MTREEIKKLFEADENDQIMFKKCFNILDIMVTFVSDE
jgi:hypothetical protein